MESNREFWDITTDQLISSHPPIQGGLCRKINGLVRIANQSLTKHISFGNIFIYTTPEGNCVFISAISAIVAIAKIFGLSAQAAKIADFTLPIRYSVGIALVTDDTVDLAAMPSTPIKKSEHHLCAHTLDKLTQLTTMIGTQYDYDC